VSLGDTVAQVALLALTAGALVWQHVDSPVRRGGEAVPVLDPALWDGWMWWLLAVLAAEAVLSVAVYRARVWRPRHAVVNVALGLAFAVPVVALAVTDRLLNPDFVRLLVEGGWVDAADHLTFSVVAGVVLVTVWDGVDGLVKARRHAGADADRRTGPRPA
jgi:hypothetical protein